MNLTKDLNYSVLSLAFFVPNADYSGRKGIKQYVRINQSHPLQQGDI